jgi:hypothetical protein
MTHHLVVEICGPAATPSTTPAEVARIPPPSSTRKTVTRSSPSHPTSRGLWLDGAARGTFTVVGADREAFHVGTGALLWQDDGTAYLLQGAGTKAAALELADTVRSRRGNL